MATFLDFTGAICVITAKDGTLLVYKFIRLSDRAGHGSTCEWCGYHFSKHDKQRVPMYDSIALHALDGFNDRLTWCHDCVAIQAEDKSEDSLWLTGQYGNRPAPTWKRGK